MTKIKKIVVNTKKKSENCDKIEKLPGWWDGQKAELGTVSLGQCDQNVDEN